jgi:hypothetical protein
MGRAIGQKRDCRREFYQCEAVRDYGGSHRLGGQNTQHGFSVVFPARATHLLEIGMQQLLDPGAIAAFARVMQLRFERLELLKQ